jgi:hypothetical protein
VKMTIKRNSGTLREMALLREKVLAVFHKLFLPTRSLETGILLTNTRTIFRGACMRTLNMESSLKHVVFFSELSAWIVPR